jgi:hypothetical protein
MLVETVVPDRCKNGEISVLSRTTSIYLILLVLLIAGCKEDQPTPEPVEQPDQPAVVEETGPEESEEPAYAVQEEGVFLSEVLPGIPGNNNQEFIELYNAGLSPVDLEGWSLWYSLGSGQEESEVFSWQESTLIPANGHILLVREGKDLGIIPDGLFDVPLFERKGGLALRDVDGAAVFGD